MSFVIKSINMPPTVLFVAHLLPLLSLPSFHPLSSFTILSHPLLPLLFNPLPFFSFLPHPFLPARLTFQANSQTPHDGARPDRGNQHDREEGGQPALVPTAARQLPAHPRTAQDPGPIPCKQDYISVPRRYEFGEKIFVFCFCV